MNRRAYILQMFLAAAAFPVLGAGAVAPSANAPAKSVFIWPSNPNEGRDPFFPNSMRPYEQFVSKHAPVADVTALQLKGYSDINGRRYVIINDHTFGEGDEGDVITSGGRIHIRCVSVSADTVLVEADGARHLLRFSDQSNPVNMRANK
jgi:hypothetical protein